MWCLYDFVLFLCLLHVAVLCCAMPQGERGHAFYIVESGQLSAFKDNSPLPVMSYGQGKATYSS